MKIINEWKSVDFKKIIELYDSDGWTAYTKDLDSLKIAFENSTLVNLAVSDEGEVIGLTRSVSDSISIHYLQDIIVSPNYQRKGIGRKLLEKSLEYFKNVRTHMILTDDDEKQLKFYSSMDYRNTKDLEKFALNTFIKMKDVELI